METMLYDSIEIGKRLKEIRKKNNITQQQLAELLNVSVNSVSKYENGKITLGHDYIVYLCNYFNISADYFYFGHDKHLLEEKVVSERSWMNIYKKLNEEERERLFNIVQNVFPGIMDDSY